MRTCPKEHVKGCFQQLPFHSPFQKHPVPEAVSLVLGFPKRHAAQGDALDSTAQSKTHHTSSIQTSHPSGFSLPHFSERKHKDSKSNLGIHSTSTEGICISKGKGIDDAFTQRTNIKQWNCRLPNSTSGKIFGECDLITLCQAITLLLLCVQLALKKD